MEMRLVVCALLFAIASCQVERPVFTCASWEDCGPGGACEPIEEACSFADASCTKSGRRFSALAPAPFNDRCVELHDNAPKSALCDPEQSKCADQRRCVGDRCASTIDLEIGRRFACARCAAAPFTQGYLMCWGDTPLGSIKPAVLAGFGYTACGAQVCPSECAACPNSDPAICPFSCLGTYFVDTYTVGSAHVCWFGGRSYCLGANTHLQLGFGEPDLSTDTGVIGSTRLATTYANLAAGLNHTCGGSDRVFCWGNNDFGQLSTSNQPGPPTAMAVPVANEPVFPFVDGLPVNVDFLAASKEFSCAASKADVRCWGTVPWGAGFVAGLPPGQITDLDVGLAHACVVKGSRVVCWGKNRNGQADPLKLANDAPPTIVLDEEATRVVTGRVHTCAITKKHGVVKCWGEGDRGQLGGPPGPGPVEVRSQPPALGPIDAGDDLTCAIHADDRVRCWGIVFQIAGESYEDFKICTRNED